MTDAYQDRLSEAKLIPIKDAIEKLGLSGLHRSGPEHVGPCPVCGGSDRFSINTDLNVFNCRRCAQGGDIISLTQFVLGGDFSAALDFLVGKVAPILDERARKERQEKTQREAEKRERDAAQFRQRAVNRARSTWARAVPIRGTLAEEYLVGRKIDLSVWPPTLGFIADHPMFKCLPGKRKPEVVYRGPAMVAPIQNAAGRITAVHQTWIDPDRPGKKAVIRHPAFDEPLNPKLVRGSKKGGAIRFGRVTPGCTLVMGEGIETTLSARIVGGLDEDAVFWSAVDLGNMAGRQVRGSPGEPNMSDTDAFVPPDEVAKLIYLQDGDSDPESTRNKLLAGLRRAQRMVPGLEGRIASAPPGKDFNDII